MSHRAPSVPSTASSVLLNVWAAAVGGVAIAVGLWVSWLHLFVVQVVSIRDVSSGRVRLVLPQQLRLYIDDWNILFLLWLQRIRELRRSRRRRRRRKGALIIFYPQVIWVTAS